MRRCISRPPAIRISRSGQTNRAIARIFTQRIGVSSQVFSNGVPSKGIRKFTGIESESRSRSANSASTSCSSVSPSPAIRPLHGDSPAVFAFSTVSTRSA